MNKTEHHRTPRTSSPTNRVWKPSSFIEEGRLCSSLVLTQSPE